jgi:uncharacterized protein (DUF1330 family)
MNTVEKDEKALREMTGRDPDEAIYMLNLLRYRDIAESGFGVDGLSGREAYQVYGRKFAELNPRFGGEPIWMGEACASIIGEEEWDMVILVHYPARHQFIDMLNDPDYQAIAPIRAAALTDSRLIETRQLMAKA